MKYKLISCDLDGSLLNSQKEITINTIKKIKELEKQGVKFVIATGRPYTGTKRYLDVLENNNLVILYNGAVIRNNKTGEVVFNEPLIDVDAKQIIDIINKHNGTYIYWRSENPYVNRIDDYIKSYVKISKIEPLLDDKNYHNITKIIWFNESDLLIQYEKSLFNELKNVNHFTSEPTYLEFVNKSVSKEEALKKVCIYYGISLEEVIAIGDGNNDRGMIKIAGLGVTLDNAKDIVKKAADVITKSNDQEGVLAVLNKYF